MALTPASNDPRRKEELERKKKYPQAFGGTDAHGQTRGGPAEPAKEEKAPETKNTGGDTGSADSAQKPEEPKKGTKGWYIAELEKAGVEIPEKIGVAGLKKLHKENIAK